jgi:hypothetical protein
MLGSSETISELPTVSRVMKNRSTQLVCITDIATGLLKRLGTPITPLL